MAPRGRRERQREMGKKASVHARVCVRERKNARSRAEERERESEREQVMRGSEEVWVEKRRTGIWYRRHCFRSAPFSLLFSPRVAKVPRGLYPLPRASLGMPFPAENYPLTTGCLPFKLLFHLSSVSLPAFFHT